MESDLRFDSMNFNYYLGRLIPSEAKEKEMASEVLSQPKRLLLYLAAQNVFHSFNNLCFDARRNILFHLGVLLYPSEEITNGEFYQRIQQLMDQSWYEELMKRIEEYRSEEASKVNVN